MSEQQQEVASQRSTTSPTKTRAQTASSPNKKKKSAARQSSTIVAPGSISKGYEVRGYTEQVVTLDHMRTVETEVKRERTVTESVQNDNALLRKQLARANQQIAGLQQVRGQQANEIAEQAQHIGSLEQVRDKQKCHIDLLEKENDALKAENEGLLDDKEQLQRDVQAASDYILTLEEKCYQANKVSLDLLQDVRNLEAEIQTLKAYIIDLKSRIAVYIPVKADNIDKKLAEYINNYPDRQKLKIMFMRESEGVYEFGSRRVMVKVEREKIQIKVGGGFLSIDEFLDQYTPVELEKLERKDPLKRFNERVAIQKVLGDKVGVETSPVRRQSSPMRRQSSPKKRAV